MSVKFSAKSPYPQDHIVHDETIPGMEQQVTLQKSPLLQLDFEAPLEHIADILEKYDRVPVEIPAGSGKTVISVGTFNQRKDMPVVGNVSLGRNTYLSIHVKKKGSDHAETFYLDFYQSSAAYRFVNKHFNNVNAKAGGGVVNEKTSDTVISQASADDTDTLITSLKMSLEDLPDQPFQHKFMTTTSMEKVVADGPSDLWEGAYSIDSKAYTKPYSKEHDDFEIHEDYFGKLLAPNGDLEAVGIKPTRWLYIPEVNATFFKAKPEAPKKGTTTVANLFSQYLTRKTDAWQNRLQRFKETNSVAKFFSSFTSRKTGTPSDNQQYTKATKMARKLPSWRSFMNKFKSTFSNRTPPNT